jgi:hypothetical protein
MQSPKRQRVEEAIPLLACLSPLLDYLDFTEALQLRALTIAFCSAFETQQLLAKYCNEFGIRAYNAIQAKLVRIDALGTVCEIYAQLCNHLESIPTLANFSAYHLKHVKSATLFEQHLVLRMRKIYSHASIGFLILGKVSNKAGPLLFEVSRTAKSCGSINPNECVQLYASDYAPEWNTVSNLSDMHEASLKHFVSEIPMCDVITLFPMLTRTLHLTEYALATRVVKMRWCERACLIWGLQDCEVISNVRNHVLIDAYIEFHKFTPESATKWLCFLADFEWLNLMFSPTRRWPDMLEAALALPDDEWLLTKRVYDVVYSIFSRGFREMRFEHLLQLLRCRQSLCDFLQTILDSHRRHDEYPALKAEHAKQMKRTEIFFQKKRLWKISHVKQ